jgi:type IV pilus biogenesis protein CpaD/CtpE
VLLRYTEPVTRKEAEEKVDEAILEMRKMAQKAREDRLSKFLKPYTG